MEQDKLKALAEDPSETYPSGRFIPCAVDISKYESVESTITAVVEIVNAETSLKRVLFPSRTKVKQCQWSVT